MGCSLAQIPGDRFSLGEEVRHKHGGVQGYAARFKCFC